MSYKYFVFTFRQIASYVVVVVIVKITFKTALNGFLFKFLTIMFF